MEKNTDTKNIMIVGVGGQGTLLASKLLGAVLLGEGYDVKVSEVHGMSQRGGSVVTYVRFGSKVYSPVIDKGQADVIVAFELLEAARWIEYLKPGGTVIVEHAWNRPPELGEGPWQVSRVKRYGACGVTTLIWRERQ